MIIKHYTHVRTITILMNFKPERLPHSLIWNSDEYVGHGFRFGRKDEILFDCPVTVSHNRRITVGAPADNALYLGHCYRTRISKQVLIREAIVWPLSQWMRGVGFVLLSAPWYVASIYINGSGCVDKANTKNSEGLRSFYCCCVFLQLRCGIGLLRSTKCYLPAVFLVIKGPAAIWER